MQRIKLTTFIPRANQRLFTRKFGKDAHVDQHQHKQDHAHEHDAHHGDHHGDHHHVDPASLGYGPQKPDYTEYHLSPHWKGAIGTYFTPLATVVNPFSSDKN